MAAKLTYWGFSAFKIETDTGAVILIDPQITRNPDAPIALDAIDKADLILVTHLSWDHLGNAFELAKRTGAILVGGIETVTYARHQGIPKEKTRIMSPGGRREFDDIAIQAVEAHHVSFTETEDGDFLAGQALSFIVNMPTGERIYHSGDTAISTDLKLFGELYQPNLAAFAIGAIPTGGTHINAYESALACQWLGVSTVIPMHYESSADVDEFRQQLEKVSPQTRLVVLEPGGTFVADIAQLQKG